MADGWLRGKFSAAQPERIQSVDGPPHTSHVQVAAGDHSQSFTFSEFLKQSRWLRSTSSPRSVE